MDGGGVLPVVFGEESSLDWSHWCELVEESLLDEKSQLSHPRLLHIQRRTLNAWFQRDVIKLKSWIQQLHDCKVLCGEIWSLPVRWFFGRSKELIGRARLQTSPGPPQCVLLLPSRFSADEIQYYTIQYCVLFTSKNTKEYIVTRSLFL